jgi:hypothetical protein
VNSGTFLGLAIGGGKIGKFPIWDTCLLTSYLGISPLPPVFWIQQVASKIWARSLTKKDLLAKYSFQWIYEAESRFFGMVLSVHMGKIWPVVGSVPG